MIFNKQGIECDILSYQYGLTHFVRVNSYRFRYFTGQAGLAQFLYGQENGRPNPQIRGLQACRVSPLI